MRGADWPWQDLGRDHGTAMEGYYWRITDTAYGRVVVALCGACRGPEGRWGIMALAVSTGEVRSAILPSATAHRATFGIEAPPAVRGSLERVRMVHAEDAVLDVRLTNGRRYGGRVLGPAHLLPGLPQYWAPLVLGAEVEGHARFGDTDLDLGGARAYVERNWGPRFPRRWWWGQAGAFAGEDVCVAFAGGHLAGAVHATAIVVRVGDSVARFPFAIGRDWTWRARWGAYSVAIDGDSAGAEEPAVLPVPVPAEERVVHRSRHWLDGRLRVVLRRGRRVVFRGESPLAGLEQGLPREETAPCA